MKDEPYYYQKHLQNTQKKIETLEHKKEYSNNSAELYEIIAELRVLNEISDFIWKKL